MNNRPALIAWTLKSEYLGHLLGLNRKTCRNQPAGHLPHRILHSLLESLCVTPSSRLPLLSTLHYTISSCTAVYYSVTHHTLLYCTSVTQCNTPQCTALHLNTSLSPLHCTSQAILDTSSTTEGVSRPASSNTNRLCLGITVSVCGLYLGVCITASVSRCLYHGVCITVSVCGLCHGVRITGSASKLYHSVCITVSARPSPNVSQFLSSNTLASPLGKVWS